MSFFKLGMLCDIGFTFAAVIFFLLTRIKNSKIDMTVSQVSIQDFGSVLIVIAILL